MWELSTKQQYDDNIFLQYSDTDGKINNVNIIIRNTEKEIFLVHIYFNV